jgi:hypothetical protein
MADEPEKHRTSAPNPLPNDEQFTPGGNPGDDAHAPEDDFWNNVFYEENDYKINHYRAAAQLLANTLDCSVLLHFYKLPGYQRTGDTMLAAFIPADEGKATEMLPPPASNKNSKR